MFTGSCSFIQRKLLFHPTHSADANGLTAWKDAEGVIGYARVVENPENIWLMLHGNAGQSAGRVYALASFSERDSVYIMEYPGFGQRSGKPSRATINAAAIKSYNLLRSHYPDTPVCVVGESIGSGPSCVLASQPTPPDKIVLIVPFDKLSNVTSKYVGGFLSALLLEAKWDNIKALESYTGPVDVFGAEDDQVIPVELAENICRNRENVKFHAITGGHNEWSLQERLQIRNP